MNRDDIIRMAREAGMGKTFVCKKPDDCPDDDDCCHQQVPKGLHGRPKVIERFAALVAAAEREKVARWQIGSGYATGHGETIEDLLVELEWQVRESEREACAKVCEEIAAWYSTDIFPEDGTSIDCNSAKMGRVVTKNCAAQIRARGQA